MAKISAILAVITLLGVMGALYPGFASAQTVAPIGGLGSLQLFNNNGGLATAGCLYFYQAGTTTQQATYTDSTGTNQNTNPVCLGSGARAQIWLLANSYYKIVACVQNDGPSCAPADVLFSVDQVPGSPVLVPTGSVFTGTFISGTPTPATTGIFRLASSDAICWRNTANSANLCISKDANDVLAWAGGAIKFPEIACSNNGAGFDYWCADSSTHHWKFSANGGPQMLSPGLGAAGVGGDLVKLATNGIDIQDSGMAMPTSTPVVFSSTPTFVVAAQDQLFTITLTGNVTSSTLTVPGGTIVPTLLHFEITQDATGGRTFVWPTNVLGAWPINVAVNAVTVETFVWDGTNARAILPVAQASFNAPQRTTTITNSSIPSGQSTLTTVFTETVTFPSAPGTYRALVSWEAVGSSQNSCFGEVIEGSHVYAMSFGQANGGGGGFGASGSELSSITYAAGATPTFTMQMSCNGAQTITGTPTGGGWSFSPVESSYLSVTPVLSN